VNAFVNSKLQISAEDLINLEKAINEDLSSEPTSDQPQSDQVTLLLQASLTSSYRIQQQNFH
jgi:hypothetical protein